MEFITSTISAFNWWAIVVATLSTFAVGFVWYDLKIGFGKRWAKLSNLSEKDLTDTTNMARTFSITGLTALLTAIVLAGLLIALNVTGFTEVLVFGLIVGLVLRGGAHFIHDGFTQKPLELTFINVGHDVVAVSIMTLIIGLWR